MTFPRARNVISNCAAVMVFLCASCAEPSSEPAKPIPGQRLVGTWQHDMALDPEFIKVMSDIRVKAGQPPIDDPEKFAREFEAAYAKDPEGGSPVRLTFSSDGGYLMRGGGLGVCATDRQQGLAVPTTQAELILGLHRRLFST
jgi:hypothetical protein